MATGTVKWYNPTKGYGFIAPNDGGKDVFVHASTVETSSLGSLNEGQKIGYEIERLGAALDAGEPLQMETRGWDDTRQATYRMRAKETSEDYRYFPEPDLVPVAPAIAAPRHFVSSSTLSATILSGNTPFLTRLWRCVLCSWGVLTPIISNSVFPPDTTRSCVQGIARHKPPSTARTCVLLLFPVSTSSTCLRNSDMVDS